MGFSIKFQNKNWQSKQTPEDRAAESETENSITKGASDDEDILEPDTEVQLLDSVKNPSNACYGIFSLESKSQHDLLV